MDIGVPVNTNTDDQNNIVTQKPAGVPENLPMTSFNVESTGNAAEIYHPPENLAVETPKVQPLFDNSSSAQNVNTQDQTTPLENTTSKIVDKSKGMAKIHTLINVVDPLTKEADEEEEEFIKEVEKQHGDF